VTDLIVVALVIALGMIATFIPARRITRIDPAAILKA
jgi:ABC-type antimicrobial peptide transport system permease subunit